MDFAKCMDCLLELQLKNHPNSKIHKAILFVFNYISDRNEQLCSLSDKLSEIIDINSKLREENLKLKNEMFILNQKIKESIKELLGYYKKELLKALPLFISGLFIFKIIRLISQ